MLSQIENVQATLLAEQRADSRANVFENALNIVNRNKAALTVGCRMKGSNISQLE